MSRPETSEARVRIRLWQLLTIQGLFCVTVCLLIVWWNRRSGNRVLWISLNSVACLALLTYSVLSWRPADHSQAWQIQQSGRAAVVLSILAGMIAAACASEIVSCRLGFTGVFATAYALLCAIANAVSCGSFRSRQAWLPLAISGVVVATIGLGLFVMMEFCGE